MALKGRFRPGEFLPLLCVCRDASGTPTVPDNPPFARVYDSASNRVLTKELPPIDRYTQAGLFGYGVFLGPAFAPGRYRVEYRYAVNNNGYHGLDTETFEVLDGGDAKGAVISLYFFDRPHAKFVLQQLDSGKVIQGRNPSV